MDDIQPPPKRGRGRPPGSKNKRPMVATPREVPPAIGTAPMETYRAADPLTLVQMQYAMVDWCQQALRNEMKLGLGGEKGLHVEPDVAAKLVDAGASLIKAMDAHKKALALAEELSKHKTPEQLLEIAINKILAQDLPTLEAVIKRLRKKRQELAPVTPNEARRMGDNKSAAEMMAELEAE